VEWPVSEIIRIYSDVLAHDTSEISLFLRDVVTARAERAEAIRNHGRSKIINCAMDDHDGAQHVPAAARRASVRLRRDFILRGGAIWGPWATLRSRRTCFGRNEDHLRAAAAGRRLPD
jgi:hypothetical protein